MTLFVEYPLVPALIGALLLALGRWRGRRVAVGIGLLWVVYAAYEMGMRLRWLCTGECNIRVDLLIIYPVLLGSLMVAAVSVLRSGRAGGSGA